METKMNLTVKGNAKLMIRNLGNGEFELKNVGNPNAKVMQTKCRESRATVNGFSRLVLVANNPGRAIVPEDWLFWMVDSPAIDSDWRELGEYWAAVTA